MAQPLFHPPPLPDSDSFRDTVGELLEGVMCQFAPYREILKTTPSRRTLRSKGHNIEPLLQDYSGEPLRGRRLA
jgi:hypothetical protein